VIEIVLFNTAAGIVVGAAWVIQSVLKNRNGNSKLTRTEHDRLCEPIKESLKRGEKQFDDLNDKIDANHKEILGYLILKKGE
jgi:hypothetical protein